MRTSCEICGFPRVFSLLSAASRWGRLETKHTACYVRVPRPKRFQKISRKTTRLVSIRFRNSRRFSCFSRTSGVAPWSLSWVRWPALGPWRTCMRPPDKDPVASWCTLLSRSLSVTHLRDSAQEHRCPAPGLRLRRKKVEKDCQISSCKNAPLTCHDTCVNKPVKHGMIRTSITGDILIVSKHSSLRLFHFRSRLGFWRITRIYDSSAIPVFTETSPKWLLPFIWFFASLSGSAGLVFRFNLELLRC